MLIAFGILCFGPCFGPCFGQRPSRFSGYPFDQWAAAPEHTGIHWAIHLLPAELSMHERLVERVRVVVPGAELDKRRGRGELILLMRFEDSEGHQFAATNQMNLRPVQPGVKADELTFTVAAFIKPGNYRVLVALVDSETKEYSFARRELRVAPLKSDPLPQAWNDLPSVETLPAVQAPDAWFLPEVTGLLNLSLPAGAAPPPRIELLVNVTPSQQSANAAGSLRRNMGIVVPAMKVLTALNATVRPPLLDVVDVTRQRIALEAPDAAALDWHAFSRLLTAGNTATIDAKSLAHQSSMRDYLAKLITRHADASAGVRWLIVLSGPLNFNRQDETPVILLPPDSNRHIVYLRLAPAFGMMRPATTLPQASDVELAPTARIRGPMPGTGVTVPGGFGGPGGPGRGRGPDPAVPDDLELILRPIGARVAVVTNAQSFRREVAVLIRQIAAGQPEK